MFLNDHSFLTIPIFPQMRVIDSTENLLFEHDNGIKEGLKLSYQERYEISDTLIPKLPSSLCNMIKINYFFMILPFPYLNKL